MRIVPNYTGNLEVKMTNPNVRQQLLAVVKIEEEAGCEAFESRPSAGRLRQLQSLAQSRIEAMQPLPRK
ncbi:hypothetical protein NOK12_39420 [Nocardioides sp. OK12]|nr:hypothetical protein NOK12_39420 [Nocardioides sp. OK12]